ncbi:hypothetical protein ACJ72_07541 [Emergomyces africanus]|uniref:Uncharacterized protein n=1 Tax=Emergomyces africanus TaxID=1955775 RepID=A0A1B7NMV9_9EURO|nr:hypothetical protein ACJ72_07541 [Emergomyces africanus]
MRSMGHLNINGNMTGYAMVQYSPTEDYQLTSQNKDRAKDPNVAPAPHPFFIQVSSPKINPVDLFRLPPKHNRQDSPIRGPRDELTRAWLEDKQTVDSIGGPKVERQFWSQVTWTACILEEMKFKFWRDKTGMCKRAKAYFDTVFPASK